jgi:hypothetical protein
MLVEQTVLPETTARLDYRGVFGWPVHWHNNGPKLVVGSGIGAVALPKALSGRVLEGVARQGCSGPALSLPTKHGLVVFLLVESDALAPAEETLPEGVRVLSAGTTIPLPRDRDDLARWLVAPDPHQRWLPSLAAVVATIRSAYPSRTHPS